MQSPKESAPGSPDAGTTPARGLWFEQFDLGHVFTSGLREITKEHITAFAEVSGDDNPVHVDEAFARRTAFRGCIAHGALTQAVATGLGWRTGVFRETLIAIAENRARFLAPVRPGDAVRLELEVAELEAEPAPKRGHVRFATHLYNQRDELVAEGEWLCLVRRDPDA